jgi:hypothetical protein
MADLLAHLPPNVAGYGPHPGITSRQPSRSCAGRINHHERPAWFPPGDDGSGWAPDKRRHPLVPSLTRIHRMNPDLEGGSWKEEIIEQCYINENLIPGDIVLELGSNIGRSSIVAAATVGTSGRVISAEADPHVRRIAERNGANFSNLAFVPAFSNPPLRLSGVELGRTANGLGFQAPEGGNSTVVPSLPSSMLLHGGWTAVIVDCEGCFSALLDTLHQARALLGSARVLVLENDDSDLARQRRVHRILLQLGFRVQNCAHIAPPERRHGAPPHLWCFWSLWRRIYPDVPPSPPSSPEGTVSMHRRRSFVETAHTRHARMVVRTDERGHRHAAVRT